MQLGTGQCAGVGRGVKQVQKGCLEEDMGPQAPVCTWALGQVPPPGITCMSPKP